MKRLISMLLFLTMVLALSACGNDSSTTEVTPSDEASVVSEEPSEEPSEQTSEEPSEEPTQTTAQSTQVEGTYALHAGQSNGWTSWNEEDFSSVIITPIYADYIIEGNERYPAKFMIFDKPADTALYEFDYDYSIFIDRSKNIVYTYSAYSSASFEVFLEDVDEADIIDTGSDNSSMYWNTSKEAAYVMLDIKDNFEGTAKLTFSMYDNTKEISKEDMIELAKSELSRIESTMEILEPDEYWSAGKFSSIEMSDSSAEVGVTVDVSELTLVTAKLKSVDLYAEQDGSSYSVDLDLNYYLSDDAVETSTPAGNTILLNENEYTVYAFYKVGTSKRDQVYYLEITVDATGDTAYALVDDIIARTTVAE